MSFVRSALAVVAVSSFPVLGNAAPIDFDAAGYELAAGSDRSVTIIADGAFSGATLTSPPLGLFLADGLTLSVFGSLDVTVAAFYDLGFDADGTLTDTAEAFGATEISLMDGMIQALFESVSGEGVFAGVDALLVTYSNTNLTNAAGGFDHFFDGIGDTSTLRVQGLNAMAPIPLPAGLPLLLGGLACLAVARRKTKSHTT